MPKRLLMEAQFMCRGPLAAIKQQAYFPDAAQQARNALADIDNVLKKAGASLADAVASRVYVTDFEAADAVTPVLGEVFKDIRPTSTFLICQIPARGAKVEIEITASVAK